MNAAFRDVVVNLAYETLDDIRAREFCRPPDQLILALCKDARTRGLSVADPWRSTPVSVLRGRGVRSTRVEAVGSTRLMRVRPHRLRRRDGTSVSSLRDEYRRYARIIDEHAQADGATLVAYNPFVAAWTRPSSVSHVIYVGRDDWASHPAQRPWWPAIEAAYMVIRRECSAVFTVSRELGDRVAPDRAVVVPNGVDAAVWTAPVANGAPAPRGNEPYAVYAGTIDTRLDVDLLRAVARHPEVAEVVLIGPVPDHGLRRLLENEPNVALTGRLTQSGLASVVANAAVGVLPHSVSDLTRAMSPLKLYEYLAAGLPVVSTDLAPVRGHGARVQLCADRGEWPRALEIAIGLGRLGEHERLQGLRQLSWDGRLAPILDAALMSTGR